MLHCNYITKSSNFLLFLWHVVIVINVISDTKHLLPLFKTLNGHVHDAIVMSYLDIIMLLLTLSCHILTLKCHNDVACVLNKYEKILTFLDFFSNDIHVTTTG